jgi:DNA topoisomerase-1
MRMTSRRRTRLEAKPLTDERRRARSLKLRYLLDSSSGITRKRTGKSFSYFDGHGRHIRKAKILERIRSIVIPPAWKDVWICPFANGHLQATGMDSAGRKQYRYHVRWREAQDHIKYCHLIEFAQSLPGIHRRVAADLRRRDLPRQKVLAAVVRLLELTLIRIGNEEYAANNHSYGLTTMRDRHADIKGTTITFDFTGKSGVRHEILLNDSRLARLIRQCRELPGRKLFQYITPDGSVQKVHSVDVNDYLRSISGGDFTAKDFRTWTGTAMAACVLQEFEDVQSVTAARRNIRQAINTVASHLGNTAAVCRKSYIHPAILDAYLDHSLGATLKRYARRRQRRSRYQLTSEEAAVLALLQSRMTGHAMARPIPDARGSGASRHLSPTKTSLNRR